jgi:hypothetical protein
MTLLPDGSLVVAIIALVGAVAIAYALFRIRGSTAPGGPPKPGAGRVRSSATSTRPGSSSEWRPPQNGAASATLAATNGQEFTLGRDPATIGSSSEACTIVLAGEGIAPEHARIWYRQGKFLLHHVGGLSRKTYVSGHEADWVVLEAGDEVTIGTHRLVFDDRRGAAPAAVTAPEPEPAPVIGDDLARMEAAVRELWAEAQPASETAVGERSGTGKYKVHRRKDELAERVGGQWVKRGRTVVLER